MAFILFSPMGLIGLGERLLAPSAAMPRTSRRWRRARNPLPNPELPPFLGSGQPAGAGEVVLACRNVAKRFGGLVAIAGADLDVPARVACRR